MVSMIGQVVGLELPALAAAGVAAASVPIVIHLLTRLHHRPQAWGAMRFLWQAYRRHRSRLRLEQWLLLAVRCLILAVLGLALSGPGLRGCATGAAGGWSNQIRLVCIVLDDSLTSQAVNFDGRTRFDQLRELGLNLLGELGPADRVALWRSARPTLGHDTRQISVGSDTDSTAVSTMGDRHSVARDLKQMRPRHSRSDFVSTLASVMDLIDHPSTPRDPDQVFVIVLSDWAGDSLDLQQPPPYELAAMAKGCRMFLSRPFPSTDNFQLLAASPHRYLILGGREGDLGGVSGGGDTLGLSIELKLRRFVAELDESTAHVEVVGRDHKGQAVGEPVKRIHRWAPGQSQATINLELPIKDLEMDLATGHRMLTVEANLDAGLDSDTIAADNRRWFIVEVRRRLRVAIVDRLAIDGDDDQITPRQWLHMALNPSRHEPMDTMSGARVKVTILGAPGITKQGLKTLDAVMVLRPDLVDQTGWQALSRFAQLGGLVWIFVPAEDTVAVWTTNLRQHFGLDWQVGLEPNDLTGSSGHGVMLATETAVPELMAILAADWPSLLKPVRVMRRFELSVPAAPSNTWLATLETQTRGEQMHKPLLVSTVIQDESGEVVRGRVMLLATALDPKWTNLPTKPLFVPLVHESLRSSLGQSNPAAQLSQVTCGDRPALMQSWSLAQSIVAAGGGDIPLRQSGDDVVAPVVPLAAPGIYHGKPQTDLRLAVNVDPDAGNTFGLDEKALSQWMSGLAQWQWLNDEQPGEIFLRQSLVVRWGWPLLWAVLALVLLETLFARWFSHAQISERKERWLPRFAAIRKG